ncbi:MAG: beta-propeller domain-containing protein [Desulfococcaceae bacterium]|jgi:hypothetical protein|nr:beta-propeller domain-containing protein [Desulfococcaceae bacterium]
MFSLLPLYGKSLFAVKKRNFSAPVPGLILCIILFIFSACSSNTEIGNPEASSSSPLYRMKSDAEAENYIREQYSEEFRNDRIPLYSGEVNSGADSTGAKPPFPSDTGGDAGHLSSSGSDSFYDNFYTEQTVSGSLFCKTGDYLYIAGDKKINIIRITDPLRPETVSALDVPGAVRAVRCYADILAVLFLPSAVHSGMKWTEQPITGLLLADISRPGQAERLKEFQIEGDMKAHMMKDGNLYILSHFRPLAITAPAAADSTEENREEILAQAQEELAVKSRDDLFPHYALTDDIGQVLVTFPLTDFSEVYRPEKAAGSLITNIVRISMKDIFYPPETLTFIGDVQHVHTADAAIWLAGGAGSENTDTGSMTLADTAGGFEKTSVYKLEFREEKPFFSALGTADISPGAIRSFHTSGNSLWIFGFEENSASGRLICLQTEADRLVPVSDTQWDTASENSRKSLFSGSHFFLYSAEPPGTLTLGDLRDPFSPRLAEQKDWAEIPDLILPFGPETFILIGKNENAADSPLLRLRLADLSEPLSPRILGTKEIQASESGIPGAPFSIGTDSDRSFLAFPLHCEGSGILSADAENREMLFSDVFSRCFQIIALYHVSAEMGFEEIGRIVSEKENPEIQEGAADWTRIRFMDGSIFRIGPDALLAADIAEPEASAFEIHF